MPLFGKKEDDEDDIAAVEEHLAEDEVSPALAEERQDGLPGRWLSGSAFARSPHGPRCRGRLNASRPAQYTPPSLRWSQVTIRVGVKRIATRFGAWALTNSRSSGGACSGASSHGA